MVRPNVITTGKHNAYGYKYRKYLAFVGPAINTSTKMSNGIMIAMETLFLR